MPKAICPGCGRARSRPWSRCKGCGLDPGEDEETLVRAVYLSVDRFEDGDERRRWAAQLEQLSRTLAAGQEPTYDPAELERLRVQRRSVASVPDSAVVSALLRLFLPAIVVFIVLGVLLYLRSR